MLAIVLRYSTASDAQHPSIVDAMAQRPRQWCVCASGCGEKPSRSSVPTRAIHTASGSTIVQKHSSPHCYPIVIPRTMTMYSRCSIVRSIVVSAATHCPLSSRCLFVALLFSQAIAIRSSPERETHQLSRCVVLTCDFPFKDDQIHF
jgi:hypothetical protein